MQTRKKTRRKITLPGRLFTGAGEPVDVILRDISEGGCRFAPGTLHLAMGTPVQIFVGTTGPHRATVRWLSDGEVGVHFTMPLSAETIAQFQSSHIPDPLAGTPSGDFAPMAPPTNGPPRRFC